MIPRPVRAKTRAQGVHGEIRLQKAKRPDRCKFSPKIHNVCQGIREVSETGGD